MAETGEIGLFEAMYTARALRRFKPDPVPDEIMTKVLDAAIRAPSGSNAQSWLFVVVKDAEKRRQLGAIYHKASQILTKLYAERPRASHFTEEQYRRFISSVTYLFDHMHEAPVLLHASILVVMGWRPSTRCTSRPSSLYSCTRFRAPAIWTRSSLVMRWCRRWSPAPTSTAPCCGTPAPAYGRRSPSSPRCSSMAAWAI